MKALEYSSLALNPHATFCPHCYGDVWFDYDDYKRVIDDGRGAAVKYTCPFCGGEFWAHMTISVKIDALPDPGLYVESGRTFTEEEWKS